MLLIFVTESGGKSTNYRHLVRCGQNIYKSTVKLKKNGLTTKNEGVTSVLRTLKHQSAICFPVINTDCHLRSIYVTPVRFI
jgi:hypothetical protein